MNNNDVVREKAQQLQEWLVNVRRDFHMNPEVGKHEFRTQERICSYLREMGIPVKKIAGTGVLGIISGKRGGKVVALRADIDALPMQEKNDVPYASLAPGVMHSCGHDAHATILLGTARVLNELKNDFKGTVKLFFQPDEEGDGGAEIMIREGCMEKPHVDYVLGLHVMPYYNAGAMEVRSGKLNASSDSISITVRGKAAHGAYPDKGVDAILASAYILTALQSLVSRNTSPLNSVVLSFGKIFGGDASNILASEVTMEGTLRTVDAKTRAKCKKRIIEIANHTAAAMGAKAEVLIKSGYAALVNDDEIAAMVKQTGVDLLGKNNVYDKEHPSLGVEDFSYFLEKAKGAFFHLGCGNKAKGITEPNHSATFDIDEKCLTTGVTLQVVNTLKLLKRETE